jgi:methyl-accepting chemotaxis protein
MASFNLRIGAKLGIAAGVSVLLVGGMLANQVLGNQSVAESNRLLIINYLNKGNAQSVQTSMARAQIAALEISSAKSVEKIDELLQILRTNVTEAAAQIDAATQRATRQVTQDAYRDTRKFADAYLTNAIELAAAQKAVVGAAADGAVKAEAMKAGILNERTFPAAREVGTRIDKLVGVANEFAARRQGELLAELDRVATFALVVGVLVMLVLIGSAIFSVLSIARPIRRIGDVLLGLAHGDKSLEVPYSTRGDEVGDAARAAKTFKENLIRIEQMQAAQKDLEAAAAAARKADMTKLADEFQAAIGGIVNTVSSASSQLESAANTLTATADNTQELSGMVAAASEEASTNVGAVAAAAEEMSASVVEIGRQVLDSSRIAGEAVKQAEKTDARITELSQAASRIGDVVKLITAIAEQTNLLALNATIEAARAGEAGRGFAVVASEVKALAAQTAKATDEITTQIAGMQVATQESVSAIKEISGTIARISEIAQTVASTLEEQGTVTTEIAHNVSEAAKGTAEVAEKIVDVNRGASATGTASGQVLGSARALSDQSGHLKAEVEKFLNTVRAA